MTDETDSQEDDMIEEGALDNAFVAALGGLDAPGQSDAVDSASLEGESDVDAEPQEPEGPGPSDPGSGQSEDGPESGVAAEGEQEGRSSVHFESLLQTARDHGIPVEGITNEAELSERVLGQVRRMQDIVLQSRQQAAQQSAPYQPQSQPQSQPQGQPQSDWTPQDYFQGKYGGPEWKEDYTRAIETGVIHRDPETGLYQAAPGFESTAAPVAQEMNAAQQHAAQFWQNTTRGNPYAQFYDVLSEPIEKMVQDRVEKILDTRTRETQQQSTVVQFERDNQSWLFAIDPDTGSRVYSDNGQQFVETVKELRGRGIQDPAYLLSLAQKLTGFGGSAPAAQSQQSLSPPAQQVPQAPQQSMAPTQSAAVRQEAQQQSFLDNAQRLAQHSPNARGRESEGAPQVMTGGDLDSFFVRAAKEVVRN